MRPTSASSTAQALLTAFESEAGAAGQAEAALRKQMEAEILRLERERAFAYRRLNFMRLLCDGAQSAESEEAAVANSRALVRAELGWDEDSETREETLSRLAPVIQATFACLASEAAEPQAENVAKVLADFESWYTARFDRVFWVLFERHVEELPLVER
ncbi:MAG: hypothetical protein AB7O44_06555 [Hyphomicrobiaceae bacterium]